MLFNNNKMNQNVVLASIGVLLLSCAYLIYINHQLRKKQKMLEMKLHSLPNASTQETLANADDNERVGDERVVDADANERVGDERVVDERVVDEEYDEHGNNVVPNNTPIHDDYDEDNYMDENIPDELKKEIDNLDNNNNNNNNNNQMEVDTPDSHSHSSDDQALTEPVVLVSMEHSLEEVMTEPVVLVPMEHSLDEVMTEPPLDNVFMPETFDNVEDIVNSQINETIGLLGSDGKPQSIDININTLEPFVGDDLINVTLMKETTLDNLTTDKLQLLNIKELKDLAKSRNIKVKGKKNDLIAQLMA
jgi:hypothetical protein